MPGPSALSATGKRGIGSRGTSTPAPVSTVGAPHGRSAKGSYNSGGARVSRWRHTANGLVIDTRLSGKAIGLAPSVTSSGICSPRTAVFTGTPQGVGVSLRSNRQRAGGVREQGQSVWGHPGVKRPWNGFSNELARNLHTPRRQPVATRDKFRALPVPRMATHRRPP